MKGQPPPGKLTYTTYTFFAWQINQTHTTSLLRLENNKAVCLKAETMNPLPLVWCLYQSCLRHHGSKHLWSPLGKSKFQGCFTAQEENCYPLTQALNAKGTEAPSKKKQVTRKEENGGPRKGPNWPCGPRGPLGRRAHISGSQFSHLQNEVHPS